jgi:hypothetical protein
VHELAAAQDQPCYAKSPLYQEKDLCEVNDWTPYRIQARRETILVFIWRRWFIEPVNPSQLEAAGVVLPLVDAEDEQLEPSGE